MTVPVGETDGRCFPSLKQMVCPSKNCHMLEVWVSVMGQVDVREAARPRVNTLLRLVQCLCWAYSWGWYWVGETPTAHVESANLETHEGQLVIMLLINVWTRHHTSSEVHHAFPSQKAELNYTSEEVLTCCDTLEAKKEMGCHQILRLPLEERRNIGERQYLRFEEGKQDTALPISCTNPLPLCNLPTNQTNEQVLA